MYSVTTLPLFSSSSSLFSISKTWAYPKFPRLSFSTPRRSRTSRRKKNKNKTYDDVKLSPDSQNLKLVLDFDRISSLASSSSVPSSKFQSYLHQFISLSDEAYKDLKTLITYDDNRNLVVSCRKSTLQFVGSLLLLGCVLVFVFRVLLRLGLEFKDRSKYGRNVVVRRDRSLGGREVIVGTSVRDDFKGNSRVLRDPLSPGRPTNFVVSRKYSTNYRVRTEEKLPKWWPVTVANQVSVVDQEAYQREANRLVRAIMDNRTSGEDIKEDDIIQLRRICRTSGVRVFIDTANTRDSFFRASIDFILNVCSRAPSHSDSVQVDGEDAPQFIAGLSNNIGLENSRAARMVSAAVAACTRSRFLQAWALEMQGKHSEVSLELLKICRILHVFPPEESSPEMEMVARGLEKLLNMEQRELLMNKLVGVCGEESHRSAAEALGLMTFPEGVGDEEKQYM